MTFAPIMGIWFFTLATIGVWRITFAPKILQAFNPWEAISYLIREKKQGFIQMGKLNSVNHLMMIDFL